MPKAHQALITGLIIALFLITGCGKTTTTVVPSSTAATAITAAPPTTASPTINWNDRSIFRKNLIQSEQTIVDQLSGASIYHIDLLITDDFSLQGKQIVRYTNQENKPLNEIYFRLIPNASGGKATVTNVKVEGQAVEPIYEFRNSAVRVPLSTPLLPGKNVVVELDFNVTVPREMGGYYGMFGYLDGVLVLDEFYPVIPVYDDQGWHAAFPPSNADPSFNDVGFYVVRVTASSKLTLVASGIETQRESADNKQITTFVIGPARDFYLAASERYVVISEVSGETKINSYAFKGQEGAAKTALKSAVDAIKKYGTRFGAYPYTEFDIVTAPMGALGIEYPGATNLAQSMYETSGTAAVSTLESTTAHEVGHQWFYNIVGNDQVNEPWLDEALTQYVTGLYYLDMHGTAGMQGVRNSWESRWARVNNINLAIGLPAGDYQGREYGAIVYGRGPLFFDALAKKMGQTELDKFLRAYYEANKWGISTTAIFKQMAEKHCQCNLTPLFEEWVYKK